MTMSKRWRKIFPNSDTIGLDLLNILLIVGANCFHSNQIQKWNAVQKFVGNAHKLMFKVPGIKLFRTIALYNIS